MQGEDYLLHLYGYIALNPVRANMIEDPGDYHGSSYQINGTPHPIYMALHSNAMQLIAAYFHPTSKVNDLKLFASTLIRE
jgi:putative transposase